ncbi:MAG: hypothetical protein KDK51_07700, partial [Deltaproteobacteria bacterium]|nr:hypothetical protein [Deltaproteobacteria bacterium]
REGKYVDVGHQTFRSYLKEKPLGDVLEQDWLLHLTTTFPEVRLKNHLEFRSIDSGPLRHVMSSAAMIKGLIYHPESLQGVLAMFDGITAQEVSQGIQDVAVKGMQTEYGGRRIASFIKDIYALAEQGLSVDEKKYLENIWPYVEQGLSPAEQKIQNCDFDDPNVWKVL